ncbi:MAG TPA: MlaD family protein [Verrucomicrobiae bacterium]|nr:MlaD family protein [Verrucomicrobiae bacterium]
MRTRLSRMERAVGWFVMLATALLVFGFGYYMYQTAKSKGWFNTKARFFTFLNTAAGLKPQDPVELMGFQVGRITRIDTMPPREFDYNIYLEFEVDAPYYGYMWTEGSRAKVAPADFLGKRSVELTKGTGGHAAYISFMLRAAGIAEAKDLYLSDTNWRFAEDLFRPGTTQALARAFRPLTNVDVAAELGRTQINILNLSQTRRGLTGIWNEKENRYDPVTDGSKYWLHADESPALTQRLEDLVNQVQSALPNILKLTNQLSLVLSNSANLTSNLNFVAVDARPAVSNLALITAQWNRPGAFGEWLLPTNLNQKLDATLTSANTNLDLLAANLDRALDNLAGITSNLNAQVQANTNMLSSISKAVIDTDNLVQGLKHHWLLRSAFKHKATNAPPEKPAQPLLPPKERGEQR